MLVANERIRVGLRVTKQPRLRINSGFADFTNWAISGVSSILRLNINECMQYFLGH